MATRKIIAEHDDFFQMVKRNDSKEEQTPGDSLSLPESSGEHGNQIEDIYRHHGGGF